MQPKIHPPRINTDFPTTTTANNSRADPSEQSPLEKAVDYINHQFSKSPASTTTKAQQHKTTGSGSYSGVHPVSVAIAGPGFVTGVGVGLEDCKLVGNPLVVEVERTDAGNCGYGWDSTGQKVWLGYRSDAADGFGSPPSPSTIETSTDSYGGDHAPPSSGTYSSVAGDDLSSSMNASDYYQDGNADVYSHPLLRARSVSQPSSFSSRKQGFHLNIPHDGPNQGFSYAQQPETVSPAMLNGGGGIEAQYVMSASGHIVASSSPSGPGKPDYFTGHGDSGTGSTASFGMDVDFGNVGRAPQGSGGASSVDPYMNGGPMFDDVNSNSYHRYGYRLPASQPSSPVRSGYPPGMAPYAAASGHTGTRPRGVTVSGLSGQPGYHDLARLRTINPSTHPGPGGIQHTVQSQMPAQQISHQHTHSSPFQYVAMDSPGGQSASSYSTATGEQISPFQVVQPNTMAVPSAPSTPAPLGSQSSDVYMNGTPSRLAFSNMSMMGGSGGQMVMNAVPLLETQAQAAAYAIGPGEISMEPNYMQAMNGMASGPPVDDYLMDSMRSHAAIDSRRSSASTGGFMGAPTMASSFTGLVPMTEMLQAHAAANNGTMTPDLATQVQNKLSFLDSLANSVAQARAEILRGDGNAADDHISNVGNAILEQALAPTTQTATGTVQPAMHLTLPVLDDLVAQAAPTAMLSDATAQSPATGQMQNGVAALAPPIQLKRSNSQKRSAPESPLATETISSTNKHMRLDDVTMDSTEHPLPAINKVLPPAMVHSHSFPNVHQLPSQAGSSAAASAALNDAMATSANFASQLAPNFNIPHVPSPLSALPLNAQDPSSVGFGYLTGSPNPGSVQNSSTMWQNYPGLHAGPTSYPGTPLETVPETGVFVSVQQPGLTTRRGSIVDGRLIAGRPTNLMAQAAGDNRSASTSAIPVMTSSLGQVKRSGSPEPDGMDEDGDSDSGGEDGGERNGRRQSGEGASSIPGTLVQPPDLVSDEVRAQLDIILLNFLNIVCSDLEFHDAKGELLHQALMPKKMAKLDESPDFRPFKFRIQAFTNAFQEELQRLGVLEEALSAKKIKSYLWTQNLISRYNDDGKKAKSKGNHIWMVNAKKLPSGAWVFKQFQRKMLPVPSAQAFVGMLYSWAPRVWDPQASTAGLKVEYTSPEGSLPDWLSWKGPVLSGTPRVGGGNVPVSVAASFKDSNGKAHQLHMDFEIRVSNAPGASALPLVGPFPTADAPLDATSPIGLDLRNVSNSPFLDTSVQHLYAPPSFSHPEPSTTPTQAFHTMPLLHPGYLVGSPMPMSSSASPQPPGDGMTQTFGARVQTNSSPAPMLSQASFDAMQQAAFLNIPRSG